MAVGLLQDHAVNGQVDAVTGRGSCSIAQVKAAYLVVVDIVLVTTQAVRHEQGTAGQGGRGLTLALAMTPWDWMPLIRGWIRVYPRKGSSPLASNTTETRLN